MDRPLAKEASFPSESPKDVSLSRLYFEGQREKIASAEASEIDRRLGIAEELHSIPNRAIFKSRVEKIAASCSIELLPLCKIASKSELFQAGEDFGRDFEKLASKDRRIFARNFVKTAQALGAEIPETVRLYACLGVEANPDILDNILLRKVAMEGAGYAELYFGLRKLDLSGLKTPDLYKLAQSLDDTDNSCGLRETPRGKTIPDAWHSIFQVKKAEEAANKIDAAGMSKAEIVSRYGEGALEEVEDGEGEIDRKKLEALIAAFGGGHESSGAENSPAEASK